MQVDLYSEEDILKGCRKNKRQYQEILYRKYARKMYGICMSYAGNRDMAQDILQDSFIKVFKGIKDFTREGSLEGWIRKIVSNTAIDHLRKQTREQAYISDKEEINEEIKEPDAIDKMKVQDLMDLVAKLPEGARLIFNLYALEGYSHKEIAEKMNISVGTSKSQFSRARKMLISLLNKHSA
ncbi:MAG: RNA polymerase sigma factor [Bacteroidales bacterium]|nr:RNA polymerase sigma factor [Bacteroidales bacterium]